MKNNLYLFLDEFDIPAVVQTEDMKIIYRNRAFSGLLGNEKLDLINYVADGARASARILRTILLDHHRFSIATKWPFTLKNGRIELYGIYTISGRFLKGENTHVALLINETMFRNWSDIRRDIDTKNKTMDEERRLAYLEIINRQAIEIAHLKDIIKMNQSLC